MQTVKCPEGRKPRVPLSGKRWGRANLGDCCFVSSAIYGLGCLQVQTAPCSCWDPEGSQHPHLCQALGLAHRRLTFRSGLSHPGDGCACGPRPRGQGWPPPSSLPSDPSCLQWSLSSSFLRTVTTEIAPGMQQSPSVSHLPDIYKSLMILFLIAWDTLLGSNLKVLS